MPEATRSWYILSCISYNDSKRNQLTYQSLSLLIWAMRSSPLLAARIARESPRRRSTERHSRLVISLSEPSIPLATRKTASAISWRIQLARQFSPATLFSLAVRNDSHSAERFVAMLKKLQEVCVY